MIPRDITKPIIALAAISIFTHAFLTGHAAAASFTFGSAGDLGAGSNFREVTKKIGSFVGNINFFIVAGDLKYGSLMNTSTAADAVRVWSQAVKDNLNIGAGLPTGSSFGETFPYQIVAGNHDDDDTAAGIIDQYTISGNLPNRMPNMVMSPIYAGPAGTNNYGKEYYFDYPTSGTPLARFIMISPNLMFTNGGSAYDYLTGDARYNWVRDTIDAARSAGIPWVIAVMHQNCITMGVKSCSIKTDIMNLLLSKDAQGRQRVDLILQGHDHVYQRSKQLTLRTGCTAITTGSTDPDCIIDDGADHIYTKGAGTVLVVNGAGGNGLYTINSNDAESGYFAAWMGATTGSDSNPPGGNGTWGITKITVSDSPLSLSAQFVRAAGGNYSDNFTITSGLLPTPIPGGPSPTPRPSPSPSPRPTATPDVIVASPALTASPAPSGSTLTFAATDDASIHTGSPDTNYGTATNLRLNASPQEQFLMKFSVTGVSGRPVQRATLKLRNINSSNFGGEFRRAANNNWNEGTVTWNTAPAADMAVGSLGAVTSGTWYEVDITPLIQGDGTYSLRVITSSNDVAGYNSKESANDPQLVVTLGGTPPSPGSSPATSSGDADGDGDADSADYDIWLSHYNQSLTGAVNGDFNGDGRVNGIDFAIWRNNYSGPSPTPTAVTPSGTPGTSSTISYTRSTEDFANPERGFMKQSNIDVDQPFDAAKVRALDSNDSVVWIYFHLDNYKTGTPIDPLGSGKGLDTIKATFEEARSKGLKLVIRFIYIGYVGLGSTTDPNQAEPDAPIEVVRSHLAQIRQSNLLNDYADVIVAMQSGIVGYWGEWHSTKYLQEYRREIVDFELAALPKSRMLMLRYPRFKELFFQGPLTTSEAFSESDRSRIGHHNDCFLRDQNDAGTYESNTAQQSVQNYDSTYCNGQDEITCWKNFIAQEGRFTPVGGETCQVNSPRTDCRTTAEGVDGPIDLEQLHWSFINNGYYPGVVDSNTGVWATQGCLPTIRRRLGYRFELINASIPASVTPGGNLTMTVNLKNVGYAAMFNPRPVYVVLQNVTNRYDFLLPNIDPRRWESGSAPALNINVQIPATVVAGTYKLALWLPDQSAILKSDPRYAVRFANTGVWDAALGINILAGTFTVNSN